MNGRGIAWVRALTAAMVLLCLPALALGQPTPRPTIAAGDVRLHGVMLQIGPNPLPQPLQFPINTAFDLPTHLQRTDGTPVTVAEHGRVPLLTKEGPREVWSAAAQNPPWSPLVRGDGL